MALPKIDRPTISVTTPISGQKIKVSPFTVKEQKILSIIKQSVNQNDVLAAMVDVIESCSTADCSKLDAGEFQWVFLQIRKLSSGSIVETVLTCGGCDKDTETKIDLNDFEVVKPKELKNQIEINETMGIKLKPLDVTKLIDVDVDNELDIIKLLVDYVYDEKDIYKVEDSSDEELEEFIDSLSIQIMRDITAWLENRGDLVLNKEWDCPHCKQKNILTVNGIGNFFN